MNGSLFFGVVGRVKSDKFLRNSFVFFLGSFLASAGNYFFHFLMARMLSVEHYGELQSLLAVYAIFGIPMVTLSIVLTKYTAQFRAKGEQNKIYSLLLLSTKRILIIAVVFSFIFFAFSGYIAHFLNLSSVLPVIILGLVFLPAFLSSINMGIIQGVEKFKSISALGVFDVGLKILFGVLLVVMGFKINGAVGAIALATLIGYFISFLPLRFLFGKEKQKIETKEIYRYFFSAFFSIFFMTLLYNIDVVLVKHFLPPYVAGEYGALTLIGHIIFFIGGPMVAVMFPMTTAAYFSNNNPAKILRKTTFLVSFVGVCFVCFYFFFPNFMIKALVGGKFLSINKLLGWFGIAMFFYSLICLFVKYFLSIHKTKCFYLVAGGAGLQVLLISVWHRDLWQIVWAMNATMMATLAMLLIYYFKIQKEEALR